MKELVLTLLQQTMDIWIAYSGNSIYLLLFLAALGYLFVTEKEKGRKTILVYSSLCLVGLFFFPVFSYIMICKVFDLEIYYRFLWMLPTGIVTAYAGVKLVSRLKRNSFKIVAALVIILLFILGGEYAYDHPTFERAENAYKLPQNVIDICDAITSEQEGQWVKAVFPQEMVSYVRQYSNDIQMPYGREMIIPRWGYYNPLFDAMQTEVIDTSNLSGLARDVYCEYIVLGTDKPMTDPLENYHFKKIATIDGYVVYRDSAPIEE